MNEKIAKSATRRQRGGGAIVRNSHGEPVGVRFTHPSKGKLTSFFRASHGPVTEEYAREMAPKVVAAGVTANASEDGRTVADYFTDWAAARKTKGLTSVRSDEGRFNKWIKPYLGDRLLREVTTRDLETIVAQLDEASQRGELAGKTAVNTWGIVSKLFDDAQRSKTLALRERDDNPAKFVRGPERGVRVAGPYLFPRELIAVVSTEIIPARRRRLWAFACFTGLRMGEIKALQWTDVHEGEGYLTVRYSENADTRATKATKTGHVRRVPIEPGLLPLVQAMRATGDESGLVFNDLPHRSEWAWLLRADLKLAGVDRHELHHDTVADDRVKVGRRLDFHDCRHSYGTWRAVRGDELTKISRAMGHSTTSMTEKYINEAETFEGQRFGLPFEGLPLERLIGRTEFGQFGQDHSKYTGKTASPEGFEPQALRPFGGINHTIPSVPVGDSCIDPATETGLERALVTAMLGGHVSVAEELARQLKAQRDERFGVVSIDFARKRR